MSCRAVIVFLPKIYAHIHYHMHVHIHKYTYVCTYNVVTYVFTYVKTIEVRMPRYASECLGMPSD